MLSVSCKRCSLYDAHPVPGASSNGLLDTGSPSGGGEEGLAIAAVVGMIRCGTGAPPPRTVVVNDNAASTVVVVMTCLIENQTENQAVKPTTSHKPHMRVTSHMGTNTSLMDPR